MSTSNIGRTDAASPGLAPPLSLQDTVPNLREDLVVARGASPGQFEVRDPKGSGALVLHDVQLQVGRMLDGRRRVADVVANAHMLGIPVDVEGLSTFVRSLEQQRFLSPPGSTAGGPSRTRPPRKVWHPRTREQFQSAMRLVREGRPHEAVPIFGRLASDDPDNVEAREMLALIAVGHALAARPIGELLSERRREGPTAARRGRVWAVVAVVLALALGGAIAWRLVARSEQARLPDQTPPGPGSCAAIALAHGNRRARRRRHRGENSWRP
jgi:hypothetical protein